MGESVSELLSVAEVARRVGLTPAAVKAHDDCLRPVRIGARAVRWYRPDAVEDFIREREREKAARLDALPSTDGRAVRRG